MSEMRGPVDFRKQAAINRQMADAIRTQPRRKKRMGEIDLVVKAAILDFMAGFMDITALLADRRDRDWIDYQIAGAPYGNTYEGVWRWLRERRR